MPRTRHVSLAVAALTAALIAGFGVPTATPALAETVSEESEEKPATPAALDFKMTSLSGEEVDLSKYHGKVVLIVNTASKCGLTRQYAPLQKLHEDFAADGLAILGFPANNFGKQEPGTDEEIEDFCEQNYGVEFDMFSKVSVKGDDICPLYKFLTSKETNGEFAGPISWNFEKFLISRDGKVVARFAPRTNPNSDEVLAAIKAELAKPIPAGIEDDKQEE